MDHNGHWSSYPIYAAGVLIGSMSPQEWLVWLSLLAVLVRIVSDLPDFLKAGGKFADWAGRLRDKIRGRDRE